MWTKELLPLFESRKLALIESLRAARTGADSVHAVAAFLDNLGQEFEAGLTLSEKRVAMPLLLVLQQSCGCLAVTSSSHGAAHRAAPEPEPRQAGQHTLVHMVVRAVLRIARASGFRIASSSSANSTATSQEVAREPSTVAAALAAAITAFDQACKSLDPQPRDEPCGALHVDLELVEFLQQLEGDSRQLEGQRFLVQRLKQVPYLLRRLGMRSVWPDAPEAAAKQEWFEKVVDPDRTEPGADFPAIVGEGGLVLEGRVLIPPTKP